MNYCKNICLCIVLITGGFSFASSAYSATWYVRPSFSGKYGLEDGSSYESAFNGLYNIIWESILPGDTLYICGTHSHSNYVDPHPPFIIGASGIEGQPIIIDGGYPGDPGIISGAVYLGTSEWLDNGDGTWSQSDFIAPAAPTGDIFEATALGGKDEKLLHHARDRAAVTATDGSFWLDDPNDTLYVNPYGNSPKPIYYNWLYPLHLNGRDFIVVRNLTLRGGASDGGIIIINKDSPTSSNGIVIEYCDIGFGGFTGIYWRDNEPLDGLTIRNCKIHHTPTGTYWLHNSHASANNITITNNELWSGEDVDGIFEPGKGDRHALGGQSGDNVVIHNNYIHDWAGDGIGAYKSAVRSINNWTITKNIILNLNDTYNQYYHRAIQLGGTNGKDFGDGSTGWLVADNIIIDCGGHFVRDAEGIGIRIKGVKPAFGSAPKIYNNIICDCNYNLYLVAVDGAPNSAWEVRNNICLLPKTGGYHVYVGDSEEGADLSGIVMNDNIYYPDTSNGNNKFKWRASPDADNLDDFRRDASLESVIIESSSIPHSGIRGMD